MELVQNDTQFYKDIALGGPALNAVISLPGLKLMFVNLRFGHYLGYTNELIGNQNCYFTELMDNYQLQRLLYQLESVKDNPEESDRDVIYLLKNKKGELRPYYLYAHSVPSADPGQTATDLYHITLHPDNSKWEIPFTSFTTREIFLEHFDSDDFGTFEWVVNIDEVFWSAGVYRIYEASHLDKKISSLFDKSFIHPNDQDRVAQELNQAIQTGSDLNIDFKIITARHKLKNLHCLARTIKDEQGVPIKFAGSLRDVTELRSREDDLKTKVKELYHSNKELEEFAYVASHDMQEPLRKITTFSDRLSEKYKDVLTGDGAMYLARMVASAENMRLLINDLLEFSRISKTAQSFHLVDLNTVLLQVKSDLELTVEETGTIIKAAILPSVDAISSQMKQLFSNIITNAIKFHKPGINPVITIEAEALTEIEALKFELPPETPYYKVLVTDNGIGFESEYATRIFQVFQRLHGKSEYPGSGIGLAICKKIIECHHGAIYAENIPHTGARFIFILPQYQQQYKETEA